MSFEWHSEGCLNFNFTELASSISLKEKVFVETERNDFCIRLLTLHSIIKCLIFFNEKFIIKFIIFIYLIPI